MDALTATEPVVFVIDIKTIPALHITNQPRQFISRAPLATPPLHCSPLKADLVRFSKKSARVPCEFCSDECPKTETC